MRNAASRRRLPGAGAPAHLAPVFHKAHIENLALMVVGVVFAQSFSLPAVLTGFKTCCGKLARSFTFFRGAGAGSPKGHRATRLHQVSSGTAQDATPRRVAGERDNVSDAVCAEEDDVPADSESRRRVSKCWSRLCKLRVGAVGHAAELAVTAERAQTGVHWSSRAVAQAR